MRLAIRFLGLDLLTIDASTDDDRTDDGSGEATSIPLGFIPSPGDQRWERGADQR